MALRGATDLMPRQGFALLFPLMLLARIASADDTLARAAEREKGRRQGRSVPAYSDADLRLERVAGRGTYSAPAGPQAATAASHPAVVFSPAPALARPGEAAWRARASAAREAVKRADEWVARTKFHLDGHVLNLMQSCGGQQISLRAHIASVASQLDAATRAAAAARQAVTDLEDEARRGFVPPGWLREP